MQRGRQCASAARLRRQRWLATKPQHNTHAPRTRCNARRPVQRVPGADGAANCAPTRARMPPPQRLRVCRLFADVPTVAQRTPVPPLSSLPAHTHTACMLGRGGVDRCARKGDTVPARRLAPVPPAPHAPRRTCSRASWHRRHHPLPRAGTKPKVTLSHEGVWVIAPQSAALQQRLVRAGRVNACCR